MISKSKVLPILVVTMICSFPILTVSQTKLIAGRSESGILVTVETQSGSYKRSDSISLTYHLENRSDEDIYLVMPTELSLGVGYKQDNRLYLDLYLMSLNDEHSFQLPKLERIVHGKAYTGHISCPLSRLDAKYFKSGSWLVYADLGYLLPKDVMGLRRIGPGIMGADEFNRRQKKIAVGPVELEFVD
jgi:hypothetical protein